MQGITVLHAHVLDIDSTYNRAWLEQKQLDFIRAARTTAETSGLAPLKQGEFDNMIRYTFTAFDGPGVESIKECIKRWNDAHRINTGLPAMLRNAAEDEQNLVMGQMMRSAAELFEEYARPSRLYHVFRVIAAFQFISAKNWLLRKIRHEDPEMLRRLNLDKFSQTYSRYQSKMSQQSTAIYAYMQEQAGIAPDKKAWSRICVDAHATYVTVVTLGWSMAIMMPTGSYRV